MNESHEARALRWLKNLHDDIVSDRKQYLANLGERFRMIESELEALIGEKGA